jgi:hypothetical protein
LPTPIVAEPAPPPAATPNPTPSALGPAPRTLAVGEGPDTLVLKISQDFWMGSAQYAVAINGKSLGGAFMAGATAASKTTDTLTIRGDWGEAVTLSIRFLNDAQRPGAGDRNLYLDDIEANGVSLGLSAAFLENGVRTFTIDLPDPTLADSGTLAPYPMGSSPPGDLLFG